MSNRSLKEEIGNKGEVIRKFSATLNNTNNLLLRDCPFKDLTKDKKNVNNSIILSKQQEVRFLVKIVQ